MIIATKSNSCNKQTNATIKQTNAVKVAKKCDNVYMLKSSSKCIVNLIFVIFFTRARFLEKKFYTQKRVKKKTDFATK